MTKSKLEIDWPDNVFGRDFCSVMHPTEEGVYCRRQPGHPGDHAAFVHKITEPESWPATCSEAGV